MEDSTIHNMLDWLFGKKALEKAAGSSTEQKQEPQSTNYLQEQLKKTELQKTKQIPSPKPIPPPKPIEPAVKKLAKEPY